MLSMALVGPNPAKLASSYGDMGPMVKRAAERGIEQAAKLLRDEWRRTLDNPTTTPTRIARRSGKLYRSVRYERTAHGWEVYSDSKYARAHEHGHTYKPRVVRPRKKGGVLAFSWKGEQVFAKSVRIPAVVLRARPHLAPSVKAWLPRGREAVQSHLMAAVRLARVRAGLR